MEESPVGFSKEENNFEILDNLIKKVAPSAVRKCFDIIIPPKDLAKQLTNNAPVIQNLISKRVINVFQQDQLQRVPGVKLPLTPMSGKKATSSADFDVTLMICLLRSLNLVPEPVDGWDKLPRETDISLGAHLTTIKICRNKLSHSSESRIDDKSFQTILSSLKMALSYLSKGETDAIVCEIERRGIDGSRNEKHQCKLQCHSSMKENTACLLKEWKHEVKMFYETKGTLEIWKQIKNNNTVMITGHSGVGKSATMKYLSLKLEQDGYEVIPISTPNEILSLRCNGRKQLFVIDDIIGKYRVNELVFDSWRRSDDRLQIVFKDKGTKLLCTLRRQLLNGTSHFSFSTVFTRNIVDLDSNELQLSATEKIGIFENYLFFRNKEVEFDDLEIKTICSSNFAFPLLCNMFSSNSEFLSRRADFFRSPSIVYKEELDRLQTENKEVYCVLVLVVIFDKENLNRIFDFTCEIVQRDKFNLILQACDLPYSISRNRLYKHLQTLKGTFVGFENPFVFIHDNLEEAISSHFGSCFPGVMLQCCKGDFIRERVRITKRPMDDDHVLMIRPTSFDNFSERALIDIKNGKFYDILLSEPWQNKEYVNTFLSYLKKNDISLESLEDIYSSESLSPLLQARPKFWNVTNTNRVALVDVLQNRQRLFIYWLVATGNHMLFSHVFDRPKSIVRQLREKISTITDLLHVAVLGENIEMIRNLIDRGGNINSCDKYGIPLLCKIAGTKRCDIAKLLIEKGADVNQIDEVLGWSPCFVACWFNEIEMLELLLSRGGEVDIFDCKFRTPLAVAVLRNNQKAVSVLMRYNPPIFDDLHEFDFPINSRRVLQDALQNRNQRIVEKLLSSGTVTNYISGSFPWSFQGNNVVPKMLTLFLDGLKEGDSSCPLQNDYIKICDAIFNHNFNMICKTFHKGETITHVHSLDSVNSHKYIKMLLANFKENYLHFSPLHFAAVCDFNRAAKILVDYGANPFQKDATGRTSLHLAQSSDMVEILLKTKYKHNEISDIPLRTSLKNSFIFYSTFKFVPSAIRISGHSQSIINIKDNFGNTPLHSVVMTATNVAKCLTTLETMIQHGADPRIRCKKGVLPLDHFRTISLFLNEGDVDRGESILGCSKTTRFLKKERCCLLSFMFIFILGILLMHISNANKTCISVKFFNENKSISYSNEDQLLNFQCMSIMQLLSLLMLHAYILNNLTFIQSFIFGGIQNTPTRSHLYAEHLFAVFSWKISLAMIFIRHIEILFFDLSHHIGQEILNMYCIFLCTLLYIIYFSFPLKTIVREHHIIFLRISRAVMLCFVIIWIIVLVRCDPVSLINERPKQGFFYLSILYYLFWLWLSKVISWYLFIFLFVNRVFRSLFYNLFQPCFWQGKTFSVLSTRCILIFVIIDILVLPVTTLLCSV